LEVVLVPLLEPPSGLPLVPLVPPVELWLVEVWPLLLLLLLVPEEEEVVPVVPPSAAVPPPQPPKASATLVQAARTLRVRKMEPLPKG
jgi:hypothetical protein